MVLKEKEEMKKKSMLWSRLPPPNMDLYSRKPVVLLNWEDMDDTTDEEFPDNDFLTRPEDVIDVDLISDNDSFKSAESEIAMSLIDKDFIDEQESKKTDTHSSLSVEEEGEHVPSAPEFIQELEDDDNYSNGSDMDLFAGEDLDRLYDDVDQQLKEESFTLDDSSLGAVPLLDDEDVILIESGDSSPIATEPQSYPQESSEKARFSVESSRDVRLGDVRSQAVGSQNITRYKSVGSSSDVRVAVSRREENVCNEKVTRGTFSSRDVIEHQLPTTAATSALRARSSSSDSKHSRDSDEPPPVNWGHTRTAATNYKVKDEPKAHCSKDILPPSCFSSHPPPPRHNLVVEKCPICDLSFPTRSVVLSIM